jgi:hypothetical protein
MEHFLNETLGMSITAFFLVFTGLGILSGAFSLFGLVPIPVEVCGYFSIMSAVAYAIYETYHH